MKQHAPHKLASLCALICAGISCMHVALAEDDPDAALNAVSAVGPTEAAAVAALLATNCALPELADAATRSRYAAICSDESVGQLRIASAPTPAAPSDTDAVVLVENTVGAADQMPVPPYDEDAMDKLVLSLLDAPVPDAPVPPLSQDDGLQPAHAVLREQEADNQGQREPVQSAEKIAAIPLSNLEQEPARQPEPAATAASERAPALPVARQEIPPVQPAPIRTAEAKPSGNGRNGQGSRDAWLAAVDDSSLDQMRGGFDTGSGLLVSFGIQRAVYINGNLVTTTSFNIPDVAKVSGAQAAMLAAGTASLVQNGSGNSIEAGALSQAVGATVIQNTLNNQKIQNMTIINTTTNSLGMLKGLNTQATLRDALSSAVGAK